MNMTCAEAVSFLDSFLLEIGNESHAEIVIIPAFTAIGKVSERLSKVQNVKLGAQNMSPEKSGAFTGEISAGMLRELFVHFVVLGHSERRTLFGETDAIVNKKLRAAIDASLKPIVCIGETDAIVNKKLRAAIDASLKPIVCIGETLAERDGGKVEQVLETQVKGSLAGLTTKELAETVVAYEPVWAIGTGRTASPEQAQEAHAFIRKQLAAISDAATAEKVRIQYGGSVKPDNTTALMSQADIDGGLVGGASLDPRSFAEIVKNTAKLVS